MKFLGDFYEDSVLNTFEGFRFRNFETILFSKYKDVMNGELGCHPTAQIKIKLRPGSKPHWRKPYAVPFARREAFRRELQSLIKDGVLVRIGPSAW